MESYLKIFRSILIEGMIVLMLLRGLKDGIQNFDLPDTFHGQFCSVDWGLSIDLRQMPPDAASIGE